MRVVIFVVIGEGASTPCSYHLSYLSSSK